MRARAAACAAVQARVDTFEVIIRARTTIRIRVEIRRKVCTRMCCMLMVRTRMSVWVAYRDCCAHTLEERPIRRAVDLEGPALDLSLVVRVDERRPGPALVHAAGGHEKVWCARGG
eukprot:4679788-Pleurochrysis_carterae.AAC.1